MNELKILALLILFAPTIVEAQDIHWSQFSDNPIFQNPGQAGNFKGDYRFVANYRDQWRAVSVPFQTMSVSVDGRINKLKKIGIGGLLVMENFVQLNFKSMQIFRFFSLVIPPS
jgi:uncharacterized protein YukJ